MTIDDLITKLEQADGPSRELDVEIHCALCRGMKLRKGDFGQLLIYEPGGALWHIDDVVPRYTESIDAALTLVPDGFAWKIGTCCVSDDAWVVPDWNSRTHGAALRKKYGEPVSGSIWDSGIDIDRRPSGQPALALCIAALRARKAGAA